MNLRKNILVLAGLGLAATVTGCPSASPAPDSGYVPPVDSVFDGGGSTGRSSTSGSTGASTGSSGSSGSGSTGGSGSSGSTGTTGTFVASFTVLSRNNALPAPATFNDVGLFIPDGGGSLPTDDGGTVVATDYVGQRVVLQEPLVSSTDPDAGYACPIPFTSSSGTTYCDGFWAVGNSALVPDAGAGVDGGTLGGVVDIFTYPGSSSSCSNPPADGTAFTAITGIWQVKVVDKLPLHVIAITDCAGLAGTVPTGGTGTATASTDIHDLLANFKTDRLATVRGVVIAVTSSTKSASFTATIQDPVGGPQSAIGVFRSSGSSVPGTAPAVGDYIQVTGLTAVFGDGEPQINL